MDDILDEIESPISFSDQEIFTKIWLSPKLVFQYIHENEYDKFVPVLLVLAGISRSFNRASLKGVGDELSLGAVVAICVLFGGLLGWIFYYFYAGLLSWTGKWLGGKGDVQSLLRITAYAMIPVSISLLLLIPEIAFFGNGVFQSDIEVYTDGPVSEMVFYGIVVFELILTLTALIFMVIGISVAQEISIGKSVLNLILPILVILVPVVLIALLSSLVFSLL